MSKINICSIICLLLLVAQSCKNDNNSDDNKYLSEIWKPIPTEANQIKKQELRLLREKRIIEYMDSVSIFKNLCGKISKIHSEKGVLGYQVKLKNGIVLHCSVNISNKYDSPENNFQVSMYDIVKEFKENSTVYFDGIFKSKQSSYLWDEFGEKQLLPVHDLNLSEREEEEYSYDIWHASNVYERGIISDSYYKKAMWNNHYVFHFTRISSTPLPEYSENSIEKFKILRKLNYLSEIEPSRNIKEFEKLLNEFWNSEKAPGPAARRLYALEFSHYLDN